ncbi:MAG: alpha/beta hydrolase [Gemmatimonadota bacterium]|nr:alpha/beta hydrolase [Gemmatimonadota bacterium]
MSGRSIARGALRVVKGLGIAVLVLASVGAIVGAVYQEIGLRRDRTAFPAPGELVSIGSHALHIHCLGEGGTPIMLDAGAGGWSLQWFMFHEQLANEGRVCAFDRSGFGWSEDGVGVRDGEGLAHELHALLAAVGIGPVVYVGHSLGANLAQIHYRLFPDDIAGLVLIDPGRPVDMLEDFTGTREDAMAIEGCGWKCPAASAATRVGLVRFASRNAGRRTLGERRQRLYNAGLSRQSTARTLVGYLDLLPKTAYQNLDSTDFGDVPLTVVYSGNTREPVGDETEADVVRWHREVLVDMARLASGSTRGRGPVVIEGATHQSIVTEEKYVEPVLEEIRRVVNTARPVGADTGR